jgi:hypothetical protein
MGRGLVGDSAVLFGGFESRGASATSIYEGAARLSRLIARLASALAVSFALALLIGFVSFSIITKSHHSVVR